MGRETLEPQEMVESDEKEDGKGRPITGRVAVTAAILAVLASLSMLQSERAASESILAKNEAVLAQSRASDEWAFRQAKSIKLRLQELGSGAPAETERQRAEITASEERAREAERARDEANRRAGEWFEQQHRFAVGTSLLQIAIVLETVAAVLRRLSVWWAGIAIGAVGVLAFANGFLGLL